MFTSKIADKYTSLHSNLRHIFIFSIAIIILSFVHLGRLHAAEYTVPDNNIACLYNSSTDLSIDEHLTVKTNTLCGYALRFINNKNIPYVFGGGRWNGSGESDGTVIPETNEIIHTDWIFDEETLENLSTDTETGTDCTGFTGLVY